MLMKYLVDVCLVGVFPHSVSTSRDPCVRVCASLTLAPRSRKNKHRTGVTRFSTWAKWGGIWTDAWVCLHYKWQSGLLDILISPYIAQFMGCVIGRIHCGLKVVFCFRHITAYHYHHNSRVLTGIGICKCLWSLSCGGVSNMLLVLSITFHCY